ncbi:PaaI family thioesterase [Sporichthya polymorpha]|uniref:PaaI family thioesterase n=1 Tax=Sporichthya polymorpha TaxID=35751 RepID=UPI0003631919|nr:PaaI family thioesterase [Sporichthya polymorpha]
MSADRAASVAALPSPPRTDVVTDPVGAWFGARVHRVGADAAAVTIPASAPGTGGSVFARMVQGVDIAAGVAANLAVAPQGAVTADIVLHVLNPDARGDLVCRGTMVRAGRAHAVAEVKVQDGRGELVAVATVNHGVREGVWMYLHEIEPDGSFDLAPYRLAPLGPLPDVFHTDGEIVLNERTTNPWGLGQGALLVTLVEPAAAEAGIAHLDDFTVRFIAPATVGPVRFDRTSVADRGASRLLIGELRDLGADRTVCLLTAAGPRSEGVES